ncbi:MAG TPA: methyltransferase [Chthoniobacterales bacterium]
MTDPSQPRFWDERYAARQTPWDFGGVPRALREFLSRGKPGKVLIPGCGCGHEVRAFAQAGWDVDALDFSAEAVRLARGWLGEHGRFVRNVDFFSENPNARFDLIYERTFLCALPRNLWPAWAERVAHCLSQGGRLAGFFFVGEEPNPPPTPLAPGELEALLAGQFTLIEKTTVSDSLPLFIGRETWQVWRKR